MTAQGELDLPHAWVVPANARFRGCAAHEESVDIVIAGRQRHASGHRQDAAAACETCGEVNELVYREGTFRCKDQLLCVERASFLARGRRPARRIVGR